MTDFFIYSCVRCEVSGGHLSRTCSIATRVETIRRSNRILKKTRESYVETHTHAQAFSSCRLDDAVASAAAAAASCADVRARTSCDRLCACTPARGPMSHPAAPTPPPKATREAASLPLVLRMRHLSWPKERSVFVYGGLFSPARALSYPFQFQTC